MLGGSGIHGFSSNGSRTNQILSYPDFLNLKGRIHGRHIGIHNHGFKQCQNVEQEQICAVAGEKHSYAKNLTSYWIQNFL